MGADLHRTTAAVIAADEAHLAGVSQDETWSREGVLQKLTRVGLDASWWRRALRRN